MSEPDDLTVYSKFKHAEGEVQKLTLDSIAKDARITQLEQREAELVGALQIIAQLKGHSDKVVCLASIQGAAELAQQALQGKGDWVAVPREPTEKMWTAGHEVYSQHQYHHNGTNWGQIVCDIYKAMITAANKGGVNE